MEAEGADPADGLVAGKANKVNLTWLEIEPAPTRWFSLSSRRSSFAGSYVGGSRTKSGYTKSSTKSKVKKAALIGATAYGGYKLGKLSGRFSSFRHRGGFGWADYDQWIQADGLLCRNSNDCKWIDSNLYCQVWRGRVFSSP